MTRQVFPNAQVAHVWAAQSQDEGRSGNGNLYFRGRTIYSYRESWPLAVILPDSYAPPEGEREAGWKYQRVVVLNTTSYSITTTGHLGDVRSALHGRDDIKIDASRDTVAAFARCAGCNLESDYWRDEYAKAKRALVTEAVEAMRAHAASFANPRKRCYLGWDEATNSSFDDTEENRIALVTDGGVQHIARVLNLSPADIPAYDVEALHESIRAAYRAYNDPKRIKAREKNAAKASLNALRTVASKVAKGERLSWKQESRLERTVTLALREHEAQALPLVRKMQERYARSEMGKLHALLNPDAHRIVEARRYGERTRTITPEQWQAGAHGALPSMYNYDAPTLVRRNGDTLETSRGAQVPFTHAVRAYQFASECKRTGQAWRTNGHTFHVGAFQLDEVDAAGNIRAGCHRIAFEEMERLALREVPHIVKPRFPLPVLVSAEA